MVMDLKKFLKKNIIVLSASIGLILTILFGGSKYVDHYVEKEIGAKQVQIDSLKSSYDRLELSYERDLRLIQRIQEEEIQLLEESLNKIKNENKRLKVRIQSIYSTNYTKQYLDSLSRNVLFPRGNND